MDKSTCAITMENRLALCREEMKKLAATESVADLLLVWKSAVKRLSLAMINNDQAMQGALGMVVEAVMNELAGRFPTAFASWRSAGFGDPWPFFLTKAGHA